MGGKAIRRVRPGGKGWARRFGRAEMAAVVKALSRGATVRQAAAAVGFHRMTLMRWRGRDEVFREAWAAAVEESGRPMLVAPRGGRAWQAQRARRNAFTAERKRLFLEHFAATCDATASAEEAQVSVSTVFTHRQNDPAFAAGWWSALEQGFARLEAEAVRQRIAAMEAMRLRGDKTVDGAGDDFDKTLGLLREYRRTLGGEGKPGRPPGRWNFDEAFAELERRLAIFEARERREAARGGHRSDRSPGPLHHPPAPPASADGPPPRTGEAPSTALRAVPLLSKSRGGKDG